MSEQEQETPVWHAIVGDGWEPVQFGEIAQPDEEVLLGSGWINASPYGGGFVFGPEHKPRRRRKASYEISSRKSGLPYAYLKAARPGDCFMLTEDGELVRIENPQSEGQVQR